jgi:polar amino acid transport system substrate-binding protein
MNRILICLLSCLFFAPPVWAQSLNIYCEDDTVFQFRRPDGKLGGMVIDLVTEIQKRVGNTDVIQMVPWTRGLMHVNAEPNIVLLTMTRTTERNANYQWVGPIFDSSFALFGKADSGIVINNMDDAKKLSGIGVYRNDVLDQILTKEGFTNLDRADDSVANFKKLMKGRFFAYASSTAGIGFDARRAGYSEKDVKLLYVFMRAQEYIVISKNTDVKVAAQWNAALSAMKADGTFTRIFRRYYRDYPLPGPAQKFQ